MLFVTGSSRANFFSGRTVQQPCFVCTAKLGRVIESQGQGSSSSGRLLSPSIVSSSHLQSDPVLIGENRELLGAIDSRFNISEIRLPYRTGRTS